MVKSMQPERETNKRSLTSACYGMNRPKIVIDFFRGIIGIFAAMYSSNLFPLYAYHHSVGWPGPKGYFVEDFTYSAWPMFLWGFLFVILCLIIGPKRKGYYVLVVLLFLFLSVMDDLRVGVSIINAMLSVPTQYFFHGGMVGLGVTSLSYYYINKGDEEKSA